MVAGAKPGRSWADKTLSREVRAAVEAVRAAQPGWAESSLRSRLNVIARARHAIAANARCLAATHRRRAEGAVAETLSAEILPLADACRFLERRAIGILSNKKLGSAGRPLWLAGSRGVIQREPLGVVLVVGPSNYPILLPGVQLMQAIAAGNGVVVKPGVGGAASMRMLVGYLVDGGMPADLVVVLPESVESARAAIAAGVDKVVMTGSVESGRAVLADLAPTVTPATVELSGCDAVFVREDADLDLVVRSLVFGAALRSGETCIAPRRVFVADEIATELEERLTTAFRAMPVSTLPRTVADRLDRCVEEALDGGARRLAGSLQRPSTVAPILLTDVTPEMEIMRADLFAPVLSLCRVVGDDDALKRAARCPYALGATVFGREAGAIALAGRVRAGVVVVNDMIVPTADPRVPFGGRGDSGFGVTRGAEGLLEMTAPKAILRRAGRNRPHLESMTGDEEPLFDAFIRVTHAGTWSARLSAVRDLILAGRRLSRTRKAGKGENS